MILCNNLISHITQYLDVKTLCMILLYIPSLKDDIGKSYCINRNIFTGIHNITNYADTLLYFQNNYIYRCYSCGGVLHGQYYLIICPCVIIALGVDIVYTKYHIECLDSICNGDIIYNESRSSKKLKIINCQFCGINRMCFMCNLYS
jgi:hypothetical protein